MVLTLFVHASQRGPYFNLCTQGELVAAAFAKKIDAIHAEIIAEKEEVYDELMTTWEEAGDWVCPYDNDMVYHA